MGTVRIFTDESIAKQYASLGGTLYHMPNGVEVLADSDDFTVSGECWVVVRT